MVALWWEEAHKYKVLPLDNRPLAALLAPRRPFDDHDRYVIWPHGASIQENVTLNVRNRSHTITASVSVPDTPALDQAARDQEPLEGVLLAIGTVLGGWSFHVLDGRLRYVANFVGRSRSTVESDVVVPPGDHDLTLAFTSNGDFTGSAQLLIDGEVVGDGPIEMTTPMRYSVAGAGLTCGWEQGPPVGEGYTAPFRFTGTLHRVVVEIEGVIHRDPEAELESIFSEQ